MGGQRQLVRLGHVEDSTILALYWDRVEDAEEFRRPLNTFLRAQSPEARWFFLRRYWYGETVREIAQGCGVKEAKVKTSLFRTKERLRTQLESEGIKL